MSTQTGNGQSMRPAATRTHLAVLHRIMCLLLATFVTASAGETPARILILGEVTHVASANDMRKGFKVNGEKVSAPRKWLKSCGFDPKAVTDGQFALVRYFRYWHNVSSGVIHDGARFVAIRPDRTVQTHNVVEVAVDTSARGDCGSVAEVRFTDLKTGGCQLEHDPRSGVSGALASVNPIGGPGTQSLTCPGLAESGWVRRPFGLYSGRAWQKTDAR